VWKIFACLPSTQQFVKQVYFLQCNVFQKCSTKNSKMRVVEYYSTKAILQNTQAIRQNLLWEIFEYFALNMEITEKIPLFTTF